MASSAEFNVWNSCDAIFPSISMAEVAVQLSDFLMMNVIETDRLINRFTFQDWEDSENERFRWDSEAMPCNRCEKKNDSNRYEKTNLLFHIFSLFASTGICQVDPERRFFTPTSKAGLGALEWVEIGCQYTKRRSLKKSLRPQRGGLPKF
jgi:hypothetical protein